MTIPVKLQHESPANTILKCAVGLNPITFAANSLGQCSTTLIRIVGNEFAEEIDVVGIYGVFALSEYICHGVTMVNILRRSSAF